MFSLDFLNSKASETLEVETLGEGLRRVSRARARARKPRCNRVERGMKGDVAPLIDHRGPSVVASVKQFHVYTPRSGERRPDFDVFHYEIYRHETNTLGAAGLFKKRLINAENAAL